MQEWFLFVSLSRVLSNSCILRVVFFFSPSIINIIMHKQKSLRHKPKNAICNIWYSKTMFKSRKPSLEIVSRLRSDSCGTSEDVQSVSIIPGLQWRMILKEINFCCHKIHARTHTCTHAHIQFFFSICSYGFKFHIAKDSEPKTKDLQKLIPSLVALMPEMH